MGTKDKGRKRPQISIAFSDTQRSWLEEQAQLYQCSLADVVRRLLDDRMIGPIRSAAAFEAHADALRGQNE